MNTVEITGNTFPVKEQIKALGGEVLRRYQRSSTMKTPTSRYSSKTFTATTNSIRVILMNADEIVYVAEYAIKASARNAFEQEEEVAYAVEKARARARDDDYSFTHAEVEFN